MVNKLGGAALLRNAKNVGVALTLVFKRDGVDLPKKDVVDALIGAYLLPIQCLWVRVVDVAFIEKFKDNVAVAIKVLEKHDFNDVIYTYRSLNTNLYTQKTSKGRKYSLKKSDYDAFIQGVASGKIVILKRGKTTKGKNVMKKSPKTSLASTLLNSFSTPTIQKVAAKPTPKPSKKVAKKSTTIVQKGYFEKVELANVVVGAFHRVILKDNTKVFLWVSGASNVVLQGKDYKKVVVNVKFADIVEIQRYVKAIRG